jgi:hypothetical protein
MIDHIEKPLPVSCIARQTDLLSATLRCFGLGKIDKCEVSPINYVDSQQSPGAILADLHLLSSFVTGAGTQRRTGGLVETRAGIIDKNTQMMKVPGRVGEHPVLRTYYIGPRVKGTKPQMGKKVKMMSESILVHPTGTHME